MTPEEQYYFTLLKKAVAGQYRERNTTAPDEIGSWTVKMIEDFQEDLLQKVNGRVSTKWIYTHLKGGAADKLPRIDILNLLSRYDGYTGWNDFISKHPAPEIIPQPPEQKDTSIPPTPAKRPLKTIILAMGLLVIILAGVGLFVMPAKKHILKLCLTDADLGKPLHGLQAEIMVLDAGESPVYHKCDSNGCCSLITPKDKIRFVVKANYYKTDTLTRMLERREQQETVPMRLDDYAMMINIFSRSDREDWEKRRSSLADMFTEDVQIFQVYPTEGLGMEMYNKTEFIDKMTMPLSSLRNVQILETRYRGNKICGMRFIQKDKKN